MVDFVTKVNEDLKRDIKKVFDYISKSFSLPKQAKVNLSFVDEDTIQELNKTTRNIDKVTDVLTYPYIELKPNERLKIDDYKCDIDILDNSLTIGDIYICLNKAKSQAKEYGHSLRREICFLFCHGMLHILGYDHMTKAEAKEMEDMQDKILTDLGITRDIAFKSGFVTIVGDTNAGKSTLINRLVGEHVAIVSPKSQTTRENIIGVYNDDNSQIVFVDTPGYHKRKNKVDDEMEKNIENATADTEIILMLIVANKPLVEQYESLNKKVSAKAKKILLINKIDETTYEKMYPQLLTLSKTAQVDEILPISALKGKNCDVLIDMIKKYLPTFDHEMRYFPTDEYTDKNLRFMVAEIIREKALLLLDDEIPHGIQVVVSKYDEESTPLTIYADLYCEKDSHKAIILGKNGAMIKKISTMARKSIEALTGQHVNLQLFVKVRQNWRNDNDAIREFGLCFSE